MKKWNFGTDERSKRQMTYLTLLLAAVFFAVIGQVGWWLAIALALGVGIDEVLFLIAKKRAAGKAGAPEEKNPADEEGKELPEEAETSADPEEKPDDTDKNG